jgi:hypothetical protein
VVPWLVSVCHDPSLSECIVIVVPGAVTTPASSCPPTRIEWAILERANPATSSAWHFSHCFWSIDVVGALVLVFAERAKSGPVDAASRDSTKTTPMIPSSLGADILPFQQ